MDDEDGASVNPAGWGFGDMINPAGDANKTCCSRRPSMAEKTWGMAMLLAAESSSWWTSGEDLACMEEEEQAWVNGGTSLRGAAFLEDYPAVGPGVVTSAGETASRAAWLLGTGFGKPV